MGKSKTNKNELSYNSTAQHVIGGFSRPTAIEVALYLIASILFISLINFKTLWNVINNTVQTKAVDTSAVIDEKLLGLGDRLDGLLDGRVGQMIFWAIVGCIIYMLIWLAQNTIINLRNDVIADKYLHPNSYKSSSYWEGVIAHKIFFVCLLVGFITYVYFAFSLFIPILSQAFYVATYSFTVPDSVFQLIITLILNAILLYIFVMLGKLVIYSYQAIVNNF